MKRIARIAITFAAAFALATTASAQSANDPQGKALLKKVGDSFSTLPLVAEFSTVQSKLVGQTSATCIQDDSCDFLDANGTQHIFWADDQNAPLILVIKRVVASDFKNKPIPGLNIGTARNRADVLKRVRAFMPDAKVTCLEANESGEGKGIASCGASMGDGWIKILFGADNQLIEARVDAFLFT